MTETRGRYPASAEAILDAQDLGGRSLSDGGRCPYGADTEQQRFLRTQWVQGRATARVELRDALGMHDQRTP